MGSHVDGRQVDVLVVTADREFAAGAAEQLSAHPRLRVTNATTVREAVDRLTTADGVDCVVSDHDLPDTDGVAFLELVRSRAPTLPFVLFTSEGSEAVASRAISADVTEYLIKEHHSDQWDRLASLVTGAVDLDRDRRDLVDPDDRAKTLLDAAHDMIAVVRDGRLEYVNATGVDLLRAPSREAVTGQALERRLSTDADSAFADQFAAVRAGEASFAQVDGQLTRTDGTTVPVAVTASQVEWMAAPAVVLVVRDVSERERRERDIQLMHRAISEAPVGITIADAAQPDNPIVYLNREFERLTGYAEAEVVGRNCRFLQGEGTDPEPVAAMREAIDAEEPVTVELSNYRKDGSEFWNRVTVAPVENAAGAVTHYVGFQEDATERKAYEHELRRFRRAVEAAGHAIYITDADGTVEYVNPAFERITGYASDEAVGSDPGMLRPAATSDDGSDRLRETLADGEVREQQLRNRRRSGEVYHARQTVAPVTDEDGVVDGCVAIQTDVTEQREQRERLRQYERAVQGADELIAAVDGEFRYLFANRSYREFHGLDEGAVEDATLADTVSGETFETVEEHVERALAGESVQYRMTRSRTDRPDRTFDIRYHPLEDDAGEVQGVVKTMRDLTERVEREHQLASFDRLLRHNLHNELNVVLGRAEILAERAPPDLAEQAETIEAAAERILRQVDKEREIVDLLSDIATPTSQDLSALVGRAVDRLATAHPGADLTLEAPEAVRLRTIPEVERAVEEVVENAIIHADREHPAVAVTVAPTDDHVAISIADDGPGLPAKERQVIAEDADIEPLLHSRGMGLWLVKRVLTRTGGTVRIDDATPRGTVVTLVVPR